MLQKKLYAPLLINSKELNSNWITVNMNIVHVIFIFIHKGFS